MTTAPLRPIRDLAAAIRQRLAEVSEPGDFPFTVRSHGNRQSRRITVEWYGVPREAVVSDRIADLADGQQATITLDRHRLWACGETHEDGDAAWIAHEASEQGHLVFQCGCGAVEGEDNCADWDLRPDEDPRYCAEYGEMILTEATREELAATGETFESRCQPGEYVRCPLCGGSGRRLNLEPPSYYPCVGCDQRGIFDLDKPSDVTQYAEATRMAEEINAEYRRKHESAARRRRARKLP